MRKKIYIGLILFFFIFGLYQIKVHAAMGFQTFRSGNDTSNYWSLAWVESSTSSGSQGYSGIQTSDGNFILAGRHNVPGIGYAWITLLAPDGSVIWEKDYITGADTYINSIRETSDLGFIAGGRFGTSPWVMKIASDGTVEWQNQFSVTGSVEMAIETSSGEYLFAGRINSDYWIVKLDSAGNVIWQKSYSRAGGSNFEGAKGVIEITAGEFVISGFGGSPFTSWVIRIDSQGDLVWQKHLSAGPNPFYSNDIALAADGNFYIAGNTENPATGNSDFWIVKMDSAGYIIWQKAIDVFQYDYGYAITEMPGGDVVIAGSTTDNIYPNYGYMARIDSTGTLLWQKLHISGIEAVIFSIAPTNQGDIFAVGILGGQYNNANGIWALKVPGDGLITDCGFIQDAGGIVSSTAASGADTTVNPSVTGETFTAPVIPSQVSNLTTEVFCSEYGMPAADSYWAMNYGRYSANDFDFAAYQVVPTNDNAFLVVGGYNPSGSGLDYAWTMKIKQDASVLWQISLGNGEDDRFSGAVVDGSNNAYLVGSSKSSGINDGLVTKIDPGGNIIWSKTYGGVNPDSFSEILATSDNNFLVLGQSSSEVWLVKISPNGSILWEYTIGGSDSDYGSSLIETGNGDIVIAGLTYSYGAGDSDAWVLRLDGNGNILWQKTYGGSAADRFEDVLESTGQDLILVGSTKSYGAGSYDAWALRLTATGTPLWQKTYGTSSSQRAYSVVSDVQGNFFVSGDTNVSAGVYSNYDGWLFKLDPNGFMSWEYVIGGLGSEIFESLAFTQSGNLVAAGYSTSPGIDDEIIAKAFVVKADPSGDVCGCLAQSVYSTQSNSSSAVGQNSGAVRQPLTSTTGPLVIAAQTIFAESNAICHLTPTVPEYTDFIYLPLVLRQP